MDAGSTGASEVPGNDLPVGCGTRPPVSQLDATLDHLEGLCSRLEQAELRFKQLTDECQAVLQGLVAVDRRHSSVVAGLNERLGDWCHLEGKLLEESARRIEQFERGVSHEWMVIRQLHEEPVAQLKEQAEQLRLACLEAARLARFRLDSAEQAYTSYAADLERRMGEWSRELQKAASAREPWPLEGVAQLHQELRTGTAPRLAPSPPAPGPRDRALPSGMADPPLSADAGAAPVTAPDANGRKARRGLTRPRVVAAIVVAALGVSAAAILLGRPSSGTGPAVPSAVKSQQVAPAPTANAEAARDDERVADAQRAADRAGAMVEILAAPDLRRYGLAGISASGPQPYGQVLWSRSRGLAASASRLPAPPAGKVYRLWIVPDGPPVAAGILEPDAAGRASLLLGGPLKLPLPVTLRITLEERADTGGPRGPVCLVKVPTT